MQELDDPKGPVTNQTESPQGHNPGPKHEPQPSFASPAESTASLSFREDSANLPAPAPFQVIGQSPAAQTPAPFSSQLPTEPDVR